MSPAFKAPDAKDCYAGKVRQDLPEKPHLFPAYLRDIQKESVMLPPYSGQEALEISAVRADCSLAMIIIDPCIDAKRVSH